VLEEDVGASQKKIFLFCDCRKRRNCRHRFSRPSVDIVLASGLWSSSLSSPINCSLHDNNCKTVCAVDVAILCFLSHSCDIYIIPHPVQLQCLSASSPYVIFPYPDHRLLPSFYRRRSFTLTHITLTHTRIHTFHILHYNFPFFNLTPHIHLTSHHHLRPLKLRPFLSFVAQPPRRNFHKLIFHILIKLKISFTIPEVLHIFLNDSPFA